MISNFKLFPYFNISQNFVQNVQKQKKHLCPELLTTRGTIGYPRAPWDTRDANAGKYTIKVIRQQGFASN